MPYLVPKSTTDIISIGSSLGLVGSDFSKVASAVSNACALTFLAPGTLLITASGAAGAGVATSTSPVSGIEPNGMALSITTQMAALGMSGTSNYNQALAISTGIITNMLSLVVTGISPGVGTGVGMAKVVGINSALFYTSMQTQMASLGMVGIDSTRYAQSIANGVSVYLNSLAIIPLITVAGPAGPTPAATVFPGQFL